MGKVLVLLLALAMFAAALLVPVALSGNLNQQAFEKIFKKEPAAPTAAAPAPDPATPLLRAIKRQREDLGKREAKVREDEQRLQSMQADLDQLRDELETILGEIQAKLSEEDTAQQQRLTEVATSLSKMKPRNAAETLKTFTATEAAGVLMLVKDRDRTKILDSMDQEQAALILKTLQEPRI
jgi:flagellar motility protein MotE (MotC chaperone)